jgi:uncharacterized protein (DUF427 family)
VLKEDEPIYTHPRDPYTRVDILASSRHVRVDVDGVTVADSGQPRILFETGLPPRYYLPLADVRLDLLRPSATQSHCPYKGTASYWALDVGAAVHEDSSGSTGPRWQRARRSPGSPASTTRRSTSTSTESSRSGRTQNSADSGPARI